MQTLDNLKSVREAAVQLGVSVSTLNKWRVYGCGPLFCRLGRRIAYRPRDIDDFIDRNIRRSTSDRSTSISE